MQVHDSVDLLQGNVVEGVLDWISTDPTFASLDMGDFDHGMVKASIRAASLSPSTVCSEDFYFPLIQLT